MRRTIVALSRKHKIAIVGGGPIGAATALHLAEQGVGQDVVVIERDPTYAKCSAMLSAGGIRQQFSLEENIKMSMYSIDYIKKLDLENNNSINYRPNGYMFLGGTEQDKEILRHNHKVQRACGADWLHLAEDKSSIEALYPWLDTENISAAGYSSQTNEGYFDPYAFVQVMKQKAKDLGVTYVNATVVGAQMSESGHKVSALHLDRDNDSISCEYVVNAAGAWSGALNSLIGKSSGKKDYACLPVRPKKRGIFSVHCPGKSTQSHPVPPPSTPLTVMPKLGVYFRADGAGHGNYICGVSPQAESDPDCGHWGDDGCFRVDESALDYPDEQLYEEVIWPTLAEYIPAFNELKVKTSWAGFYDYNIVDQNAIIDYHPDFKNVVMATGFSGHGLQMAPAAGQAVTDLLLEGGFKKLDLRKFSFDRIVKNEPYLEYGIV